MNNPFNLGILTPIAFVSGVGIRTMTNCPAVYRKKRDWRKAFRKFVVDHRHLNYLRREVGLEPLRFAGGKTEIKE